jgi:pheromone shutdown protein TraB
LIEILDVDYNDYIRFLGTAHFTRRSVDDAYKAVASFHPHDIALELDWQRFTLLNRACVHCVRREACQGICEFTGAAEALGNVDANIWLIDMSEAEMRRRIRRRMTFAERTRLGVPVMRRRSMDPVWLWENGFKDRVIADTTREIETQRRYSPSYWDVLIDERNALMAARLAWIASTQLNAGDTPLILALVGAAHEAGVTPLLANPATIRDALRRYALPFKEPTIIRRVAVQAS